MIPIPLHPAGTMNWGRSNRFFDTPESSRLDTLKPLQEIFGSIERDLFVGTPIFRARKLDEKLLKEFHQEGERDATSTKWLVTQKFNIKKLLGSPPADLATAGRMNPAKIAYFYGSDSIETCLAECRADRHDKFVVAVFQSEKVLKLLDFTKIPELFTFSYFDPVQPGEVIAFVERFIDIVSQPLGKNDRELFYLPTQALCEYIRLVCKYDGIMFKSSLRKEGINYTIFPKDTHPHNYYFEAKPILEDEKGLYLDEYFCVEIEDLNYSYSSSDL